MTANTVQGAMLAVSWGRPEDRPTPLEAAEELMGPAAARVVMSGVGWRCVVTEVSRLDRVEPSSGRLTVQLVRGGRLSGRDVHTEDVERWLAGPALARHDDMDQLLPPYAAVHRDVGSGALRVVTDPLGFRQLYAARGDGWAALSTSSRALGRLVGSGLDHDALATLSLLGWQMGQITAFQGVWKLNPGAAAEIARGVLTERSAPSRESPPMVVDEAVAAAAAVVSEGVNTFLDDHPDASLQLTGGMDSRILLAAIPPSRRRHVTAMTLAVQGSPDAGLAARLAHREGMRHVVVDMSRATTADPAEAYELASRGAARLDCSADALAWAGLQIAEGSIESSPRLSGLGGEVVRGFYYVGPAWRMTVSTRKIGWLADWRLFPNEAVPERALAPEFAAWRRTSTLDRLAELLIGLGPNWATATDEFYLGHRMQRWAGATTTSTCFDRLVSNPMLEPEFVHLGRRTAPRSKAGSRYLSRILIALDPVLADLPLDGRPAPRTYAYPGPANWLGRASVTGGKMVRKVRQRLVSGTQPAAGARPIADLVVEHWRHQPQLLDGVRRTGVVSESFVDQVLAGLVDPSESSVAYLVTLAVAADALWGVPVSAT